MAMAAREADRESDLEAHGERVVEHGGDRQVDGGHETAGEREANALAAETPLGRADVAKERLHEDAAGCWRRRVHALVSQPWRDSTMYLGRLRDSS